MLIVKTELGQRVMKDRSVPLSPRQRSAFILVDGKRTLEDILKATQPMGVTREDIDKLFELALVEDVTTAEMAAQDAVQKAREEAAEQRKLRTPQERYAQAYPIATALTAQLGLFGVRLNLAVEAASSYEELLALAPRIRDAVGADKFKPLDTALNG
jgi:hypothetical protein